MGNQGKIAKKQSGEIYVFIHISIPSFLFREETITTSRETPFSLFTGVFESIELGISLLIRVTEMLFLWLERLHVIIWF